MFFSKFFFPIFIKVASLEIPEANEGTYHAEETIENDPNLEVHIKIRKIRFLREIFFKG